MSKSEQTQASSTFLMLILFIGIMLITFDANMRTKIGMGMNTILFPVIGFNGEIPILTLFLAAILLGLFSSIIRHIFIDWMKMAEIQMKLRTFQTEMRKAAIEQNLYKLKKLRTMQPEILKMQLPMQSAQMKPMVFIMFVAIPLFFWLSIFIGRIDNQIISLPGGREVNLMDRGPILHLFPIWILIYMLFSIPFNRLFEKILKTVKYRDIISEIRYK